MRPDPPRGKTCAREGCDKPPVAVPSKVKYGRAEDYLRDPFCSTTCCRIYHDTVTSSMAGHTPRGKAQIEGNIRRAEAELEDAMRMQADLLKVVG